MSIAATDLLAYNCLNRVTDDTSTAGGDISDTTAAGATDKGIRPTYTQWSANAVLAAISTSASDTQNLTIDGRLSTGATASETITLTGTTEKLSTNTYERILDFFLSAVAVGSISIKQGSGGTVRYTIPVGEAGASACFKRSASAAGIVIRYDLIYWKNTHATLTLNSGLMRLSADPDARIRVGVHTATGNAGTITNRITTPGGITFVDDNVDQSVPSGGTLAAGVRIGEWIEENLPASDTPHRTTFTLQLTGTTV